MHPNGKQRQVEACRCSHSVILYIASPEGHGAEPDAQALLPYVLYGAKGDIVFENNFYFVALMLTTVLNAEFALVFAEQIALTL